jgi:hypothetical protein
LVFFWSFGYFFLFGMLYKEKSGNPVSMYLSASMSKLSYTEKKTLLSLLAFRYQRFRGRYNDTIFSEKKCVLLENQCYDNFEQYFESKTPIFSLNFSGKNILKIIASVPGLRYLINFDLLAVGVDSQGLSFDAVSGLDLADDDGAHVGELVDDGHHEGAAEVSLQRRQRVDVRDEGLLSGIGVHSDCHARCQSYDF